MTFHLTFKAVHVFHAQPRHRKYVILPSGDVVLQSRIDDFIVRMAFPHIFVTFEADLKARQIE